MLMRCFTTRRENGFTRVTLCQHRLHEFVSDNIEIYPLLPHSPTAKLLVVWLLVFYKLKLEDIMKSWSLILKKLLLITFLKIE